MSYYIPELPRYPSSTGNVFSYSLNNTKDKKNSQSFGTSIHLDQYNSEKALLVGECGAGLNYVPDYGIKEDDSNTTNDRSVEDRFETDGLHISNNVHAYSLLPEWINYNYGMFQCKKTESEKPYAGALNRSLGVGGGTQGDGGLTGYIQGGYYNSGGGLMNGTNVHGNINYENGNNNNNNNNGNGSGNKRPRHFFCFSCNQFKPRSTKARFKVCKHVSCYHCLRKALHVEYWAAKNDIWEKCRAECPFCHISLDWTKMKPYIVLSIEAKQFPLMSLCDAEERQGEAFQVIHSFFPRGVPSHVIYGNQIDLSIQPKVTQILFGYYLELLNNRNSYEKFFQPGEKCLGLKSSSSNDRYSEFGTSSHHLIVSGPIQSGGLDSLNMINGGQVYNNSSSCSNSSSRSNMTGSKFESHLQVPTNIHGFSYALSCTSASTTITRASTSTNTSTTATINTTTAISSFNAASTLEFQRTLESEGEVATEYETETESEEGKKDGDNGRDDVAWAPTYDIYPDLFCSWRRSMLYSLM